MTSVSVVSVVLLGMLAAASGRAANEVIRFHEKATTYRLGNDEYYELKLPIGYDRSTEKISFRFLPRVTLRVRNNPKGDKEVIGYVVHSYNNAEASKWSNYQVFEKKGQYFVLTTDATAHANNPGLPRELEAQVNRFYSGKLDGALGSTPNLKEVGHYKNDIPALDLLKTLRAGAFAPENATLLEKLALNAQSTFPKFWFPDEKFALDQNGVLETLISGKGNSEDYKLASEKLSEEGKSVDSYLSEMGNAELNKKKVETWVKTQEEWLGGKEFKVDPKHLNDLRRK